MILSESDAAYAADQFIDYFSNLGRIDEYLRNVKLDRMSKMPTYLPGCGPEEDMFDAFDMHPNDMDFKSMLLEVQIVSQMNISMRDYR